MKKLFVAVMVLALSMPGLASALTYTPTVDVIAGWTALSGSSGSNTFAKDIGTDTVKFTGNLFGQTAEPSRGYVFIGETFTTPVDFSAFSTYALQIYNVNESTWNYSLYMGDTNWFTAWDPIGVPVAKGSNAILQLDLAALAQQGLDLQHIEGIGLYITQIVPIPAVPQDDRTYETVVAPVPEPASMLLLGLGLIGIAGIRRKLKK